MGLNKLGTAITVITAVTLVALAAEIAYVLWQRRQRLRPRVRVEPREASLQCSSSSPTEREREVELELEQQVIKFQCLNGPSRVLFTIKEEEREGAESENGSSTECSAVKKRAWLSDADVVLAVEELYSETTPFSTPCASPPYFTPYASPSREDCCKIVVDNNNEDGDNGCVT
ncbi:hypothetical protein RJT34_23759 [Clitoria ternatea]|uniref:Uncharacterized protein n=1 Tax=Clitoria ternatea TaxID=43366 RepID=A0AAN9IF94_CLITE